MDYPQLNLLFGLSLLFTLVVSISLRVLLSKMRLSRLLSLPSWAALLLNVLAAVYIESLFLRFMTSAFNRQIALGLLVMGSLDALITASLYQRVGSARFAGSLFSAQMLVTLTSLLLAFALYRSLVPMSL